MKNLPKGMIPNRDNQVYWDTERNQLYFIEWVDNGNGETPIRHYLPKFVVNYSDMCL